MIEEKCIMTQNDIPSKIDARKMSLALRRVLRENLRRGLSDR